ncbi:MAG: hypothetical protein LUD29_03305 [Clostridia bacterium]|nr:hypothetical protein [Clostridia bacterium]
MDRKTLDMAYEYMDARVEFSATKMQFDLGLDFRTLSEILDLLFEEGTIGHMGGTIYKYTEAMTSEELCRVMGFTAEEVDADGKDGDIPPEEESAYRFYRGRRVKDESSHGLGSKSEDTVLISVGGDVCPYGECHDKTGEILQSMCDIRLETVTLRDENFKWALDSYLEEDELRREFLCAKGSEAFQKFIDAHEDDIEGARVVLMAESFANEFKFGDEEGDAEKKKEPEYCDDFSKYGYKLLADHPWYTLIGDVGNFAVQDDSLSLPDGSDVIFGLMEEDDKRYLTDSSLAMDFIHKKRPDFGLIEVLKELEKIEDRDITLGRDFSLMADVTDLNDFDAMFFRLYSAIRCLMRAFQK